jgi:glycosyltransferase involved in cell wall biosynthesis
VPPATSNSTPNSLPKLIFVNRCYWPDTEATGQLLTDLCTHLAGQGHDVHVICGQPNSPQANADFHSSGVMVKDGVSIHRLRHTQLPKRFPAGRLLNLLSFTRATKQYLKRSGLHADVFISETDPFLLPPVVARHATSVGAKFIAYLQDIYPDVAEAIGKAKPGWITNRIRGKLRHAYQSAAKVIVLGSCMKDRLTSPPWSLDADSIQIIPNWADCTAIRPLEHQHNPLRTAWGLQDRFIVMHSGNMGLTQRLDVLIEATRHSAWPDEAVLMLIGDGAARKQLEQLAQLTGNASALVTNDASARIQFLPYQPREQLAASLSAADLHVVSMHENITGCLCPSKVYGILAAGRPILAIAPEQTDLARTVRQHNIGWVCPPGSPAQIAASVADAYA